MVCAKQQINTQTLTVISKSFQLNQQASWHMPAYSSPMYIQFTVT